MEDPNKKVEETTAWIKDSKVEIANNSNSSKNE